MIFCPRCGGKLTEADVFCGNCGRRLKREQNSVVVKSRREKRGFVVTIIVIIAILGISISTFKTCGNRNSLIGAWQTYDYVPRQMVFNRDGTIQFKEFHNGQWYTDLRPAYWSTQAGILAIECSAGILIEYVYEVIGTGNRRVLSLRWRGSPLPAVIWHPVR